MSKLIFVTGTGTDIGKTIVSAAIVRAAKESGISCSYWKPVQTGYPDSDSRTVADLCSDADIIPTSHCYDLPASPDQAAKAEGAPPPRLSGLIEEYKKLPEASLQVVEGAGGLLVPLNEKGETWAEFLEETGIPVLVVALSSLGTINHTCLTLEALKNRNIPIAGLVVNGEFHGENQASIQKLHPDVELFSFPRINELDESNPAFLKSSQALLQQLSLWLEKIDQGIDDWVKMDSNHCWHPFTQHKTATPPVAIESAKGVWLKDKNGHKMIDGTSSWWTNTIGHGRKEIGQAIYSQQQKIDHVIFAGVAHEGAAKLSKYLADLSGSHLTRSFFTDNGSCAVEVGLKMAAQGFSNRGERRDCFISFQGSYHGDTFGTMSAAQSDGFHGMFEPFMFKTLKASPVTVHKSSVCPEGMEAFESRITQFKQLLVDHKSRIAGVLIEPLIQGASGMNIQPVEFLQEIATLCKENSIPLILYEVFTGMARCGDYFAFQRAEIEPDIVCLAKGLTGGAIPMAVTMATEEVFENFLFPEKDKALLHGHTYTGSAIGCAAALATLNLYKKLNLVDSARQLETRFNAWLEQAENRFGIQNRRAMGGVMAFELPSTGEASYFNPAGETFTKLCFERGLFARPLGNTIYLVPPLTIGESELDFALGVLSESLAIFENSI